MFKEKSTKKLVSVDIVFLNCQEEYPATVHIDIPDGGRFESPLAGYPTVYDADGDIALQFQWMQCRDFEIRYNYQIS